ncbi:uncharacterized protein LOC114307119 [Camellia sinensis]|uniref:uncharacterized protein LOC114307119 n=1 Tax=Camellia sinensis TaxID=4442 RepID=UPI001035FED6|nr:uncharacterized protein LOC114307119 [Camellia sinensis]
MDPFFMEVDNEIVAEAVVDKFVGGQAVYVDMSQHGLTYQSNFRDAIATAMWQNHVGHGQICDDCVSVIDGTLVDVSVPASRQNTFCGHKAMVLQNVLAACDFDICFTFINSGWEGKYYLVDVDFTNMPRFLTLFRSQRYHLQEFHGHHYFGPKELFNHRHSSLRNVIERTFGVLKKRFPILRSMPNYKSTRQGPFVIACCVVHNQIRLHVAMDPFFMEADNEMVAEAVVDRFFGGQAVYVDMSQHGLTYQSNFRDAIATAM